MTSTISTNSADATSKLGERLAKILPDGAVLEVQSDLGGGKTTFIQGLARGLGYEGEVASPTFTLSRVYDLPDGRQLHHFDLYRLAGHDVVTTELEEVAAQPGTITAIEWPTTVPLALNQDHLVIEFIPSGIDDRTIIFHGQGTWSDRVVEEIAR